ncbi:MAG TPA: Gfo/Idh/MocA family oxidoreductase [Planctomycetota bacterium]|nr:Gfo/Idh/MocA family oxidoreductase [Planctomycetota bacterium]
MKRQRFAVIGTGGRSEMYWRALSRDPEVTEANELVALLDPNRTRMEFVRRKLERPELPTYQPHEFEKMVAEQKLDGIVVTCRDNLHAGYILRGLEAGLRVVTEKPMTTDAESCQAILDAARGREEQLTVTFNYRYAPFNTKVKELVQNGEIGQVTMASLTWFLDITHGADYYRRWHRYKANSGSLWVHKATHHFDLVNWWTASRPETVFALGTRRFYRPETRAAHERCLTCDDRECRFRLDLADGGSLQALYLEAEKEDGYFRDRCVFSPDMDVWDTRSATVGYTNGMMLSYSLHNYAPREGFRLILNGTGGRIELDVTEHSYISGADGKLSVQQGVKGVEIRMQKLFEEQRVVPFESPKGGHGGGDSRLLRDVFVKHKQPADPFNTAAGPLDGACSILVGIAARRSIETGAPVRISELVALPEEKRA